MAPWEKDLVWQCFFEFLNRQHGLEARATTSFKHSGDLTIHMEMNFIVLCLFL